MLYSHLTPQRDLRIEATIRSEYERVSGGKIRLLEHSRLFLTFKMIKEAIKQTTRNAGIYLASTERFGMDLELDLARLTHADPLKTIFDVGGNFGQTALRMTEAFRDANVYTFEPVKTSYEKLIKATKQESRIKPFNIALGDAPGTVTMSIAPDAGSNSILQIQTVTGTTEVPVQRLDTIVEENNIPNIDLLKIDVEGYELKVLDGATALFDKKKIRFVYAECILTPNPEMPQTSFFDLHNYLEKRGFCFVTYYAESFHLRLGCALGNVLYALKEKLPSSVPGSVKNIS